MATWPVLVECVHLMFGRIGVAKTLAWMETLGTQGVGVFVMGADHLPRLNAMFDEIRPTHWIPACAGMTVG